MGGVSITISPLSAKICISASSSTAPLALAYRYVSKRLLFETSSHCLSDDGTNDEKKPATGDRMISRRMIGAVALCLAGIGCVVLGGWHIATLFSVLAQRPAATEADSAILAVPMFGVALIALGLLVATGKAAQHGRRTAIVFACFLAAGGASIALLVTGPALLGAIMKASGYHACASQVGLRTARTRYVRAGCHMPARNPGS